MSLCFHEYMMKMSLSALQFEQRHNVSRLASCYTRNGRPQH
ncbi:MAG: hypothetical protein AAEI92_09195 [Arenicellales bacterium]